MDGPGNTGDYWSYNQGTYLSGLTAWSAASNNPALLDEAAAAARAILNKAGFLTDKKVLKEKLGTSGWGGCLFKGIMARGLRELADALRAALTASIVRSHAPRTSRNGSWVCGPTL